MRIFVSTFLSAALAVAGASVLTGNAAAVQGPGGRAVIASTVPASPPGPLTALVADSRVRLSVFVGRDQTGLAATAAAVSDPASPSYGRYLNPAQVQAHYGATAVQRHAVRDWLSRSGLAVTHDDAFVITAVGTTAKAEAALATGLALSRPAGGVEQVVPGRAISVPAAIAGVITTIRVSPQAVPLSPHEALDAASSTAPVSTVTSSTPAGSATTADSVTARCSVYYGQKQAAGLPKAYGRTLTWAPCGYQPTQLRAAYGAAKAGLNGAGATVAVISETGDPTALSDANRWARQEHVPQFARGQFKTYVAPNSGGGAVTEDALDIEAVHGMAPAARVDFVVGNGTITGDYLLDGLDTVVRHRLAGVVTSSWGRGGKSLGFANPLLYKDAKSATFHDVTNDPQGRRYTEAVVYGPGHLTIPAGAEGPPVLDTMGQCGARKTLPCGAGYDLVTGLGSPGPAFFGSFGSRPR